MDHYKIVSSIIWIYGLVTQGDCTMTKRATTEDTLIVTTIIEQPFVMIVDGERNKDGSPKLEGFLIDLWKKLNDKLGHKYQYKLVKDSRYGSMTSDGTWNGMIGEVINKEADVALAALSITSPRLRVVDFSKPYLNIGYKVLIRKDLGINNIEELMKHKEISYGCIEGGSTMSKFDMYRNPTVEKMNSYMRTKVPSAYVKTTMEGATRAKKGNYAFIGESTTIDYMVAHDCELTSFPFEYFDVTGVGLAFPIRSNYISSFNLAILTLRESGELQILYNKWLRNKSVCPAVNRSSQNTTHHVFAIMIVLWPLLHFYSLVSKIIC